MIGHEDISPGPGARMARRRRPTQVASRQERVPFGSALMVIVIGATLAAGMTMAARRFWPRNTMTLLAPARDLESSDRKAERTHPFANRVSEPSIGPRTVPLRSSAESTPVVQPPGLDPATSQAINEISSSGVDSEGTRFRLADRIQKWRDDLSPNLKERLRLEPWSCFRTGCFQYARFDDVEAYQTITRLFSAQALAEEASGIASSRPITTRDGSLLTVWFTRPPEPVKQSEP